MRDFEREQIKDWINNKAKKCKLCGSAPVVYEESEIGFNTTYHIRCGGCKKSSTGKYPDFPNGLRLAFKLWDDGQI